MNFDWSNKQNELHRDMLDFVRQRIEPCVRARESGTAFTRDEWRLCGEAGLLGLSVAERWDGRGLDLLTSARLLEAFGFACHDLGLVFAVGGHLLAGAMPIAEYGGDSLRQGALPKLCRGEWIAANAVTEAAVGSDVAAIQATARRDGDDYVLDAVKTYVTNGPAADIFVLFAKTEPAHGFLGLSAFAVERGRDGVNVGEPFAKMGLDSAPVCEVKFAHCRVPASHRLGKEGQGNQVFQAAMLWERTALYAGFLGRMDQQVDEAVKYARQRRQFGKRIARYQAISHRIAEMKRRTEAARWLLYRACWLVDRGEDASQAASLAKLTISEAAVENGLDLVRIFGAAGYTKRCGVESGLRDAVGGILASGTSDIQRELVAHSLGL